MNNTRKTFVSALLMSLLTFALTAQNSERMIALYGVVERTLKNEKAVLPYESLREADVSWEKRIWRVIDVREKINSPFVYPKRPFFEILKEAAEEDRITLYSGETDDFSIPLTLEEARSLGTTIDTVLIFNPDDYTSSYKIIRNEIDYTQIKRFRVKEIWFYDEESSKMQVRILGIAPIMEMTDDNGNFKYEQVMFWAYYLEFRKILAKEQAPHFNNDASPVTWEDVLEMRYFSSYVYKASNVQDERIQDYIAGNVDRLLEAKKIEQEIFNLEQDLWSY